MSAGLIALAGTACGWLLGGQLGNAVSQNNLSALVYHLERQGVVAISMGNTVCILHGELRSCDGDREARFLKKTRLFS